MMFFGACLPEFKCTVLIISFACFLACNYVLAQKLREEPPERRLFKTSEKFVLPAQDLNLQPMDYPQCNAFPTGQSIKEDSSFHAQFLQ